MTYTWYPFSNLTPADDNSLQAWDYTTLVDGDKAIGEIEAGVVVPYKWDATSALTEDLPHVVNPDGNGGNGRWLRIEVGTAQNLFNGTIEETFDALVTSDGATVTMALAKAGGGNLTTNFSSGFSTHTAGNIALTAGSDIAPTENFIYILESDPTTLVKSTSDWPATEHIKIGFFFVPSAGFVQTNGCYINQNWNDHHNNTTTGQGHLSHIGEVLRLTMEGSHWHSGVAGNGSDDFIDITINGGAADNVYFKTAAGVTFQMHRHTIPAFDSGVSDLILVPNDSATVYDDITDIATKLLDNTGASMSGKYFNMVFWGIGNKSGEFSSVMMNLPGGSYNSLSSAINDVDGLDVYDIPRQFKEESSTGFLIARVTFKHSVAGSGTWTVENTTDLRGRTPGTASGTTLGGGASFADNQFEIFNVSDITKLIDFDLSGITAGNTRTVTPADADMTILSTINHDDLTDGGDTTLHDHDGISENTTHRGSDGKDHSDVVLNNTHRAASAPHSGHVDTTGAEAIAGVKTFGSFPVTPSSGPTTDYQVSNKKYVDDSAAPKGKNLIINGAMQVDQKEGSPWTGRGNGDTGYYTDMWEFSEAGVPVGVVTISQDTGLQSSTFPFPNALKWDCTTAEDYTDTSSFMQIIQRIEAQFLQHLMYGTAEALDMTLSFYMKGNKAGTMCICFTSPDGARQYITEITLAGTGSWEKFELVIPGDTAGTINNDNGPGFHVRWTVTAGSAKRAGTADVWAADTTSDATSNQTNFLDNTANDLWLGGVQLEIGSIATEFEYRNYDEELRLCRRYYERWHHVTGDTSLGLGFARSTTVFWAQAFYVWKRDVPTISYQATMSNWACYFLSGTDTTPASMGNGDTYNNNAILQYVATSGVFTVGDAGGIKINAAGGWVEFDANL